MGLTNKVIIDFSAAMLQCEALSKFFADSRDCIRTSEQQLYKINDIALKISELLDTIYANEVGAERSEKLNEIQNALVGEKLHLNDVIDVVLRDTGTLSYTLMPGFDQKYDPANARNRKKLINNQRMIFENSILSNIVSIFEMYLANSYEALVLNDPKSYFENKQISISQLFSNEVSQILLQSLNEEIEKNMFDSLKTLDKINEKSVICVDRYIQIRKEFEEIYYRRNLCIHNNGKVNNLYLNGVDKKYSQSLKIGQQISSDDLYLENSITVLRRIICSLHYEMLIVLKASGTDFGDLANEGFVSLSCGEYKTAEHIYGILRRNTNFEFIDKAVYEINYINALKQQGKTEYLELINKLDFSIATDIFKIAKDCLLDNNEKVYNRLTKTYPTSYNAIQIRDWPLFIDFRKSEFYIKFSEEHADDFKEFEFQESIDIIQNLDVIIPISPDNN